VNEPLTNEQQAALRASAIAKLRRIEADLDRSEEIHHYRERLASHMVSPSQREWANEALRDLQRAGEDIPDSLIRPPRPRKMRVPKNSPPALLIDGSALRLNIKRILDQVDPGSSGGQTA
jgi:hypothetical protein